MRRPRALIVALALVAAVFVLAACGGDDDEGTTTRPAASEAPSRDTTTPSAGALPPEVMVCFADRGFEIESSTEIHSAPEKVVQECFGLLHQGGG